jgi:hypothetical protein
MARHEDLREARAEMAEAESAVRPRRPWRDRVYGRLKVSVRTMDIIIYGAVALLVLVIILGVVTAGR